MDCIDLTSKQSKMLRYVAKHSKLRKTTKVIKLQWIASIWCQKDQTNAKLQKWSNYNELHRFDVKTIKTFELRRKTTKWSNYSALHRFHVKTIENVDVHRKTFKTTENYESHQITMNCIDLMSERSNQRKTTKVILFRWIWIDLTSKRSKRLS